MMCTSFYIWEKLCSWDRCNTVQTVNSSELGSKTMEITQHFGEVPTDKVQITQFQQHGK